MEKKLKNKKVENLTEIFFEKKMKFIQKIKVNQRKA